MQPGSSLALSNLNIQLDCASWASLFDLFCVQGYVNGIVKVRLYDNSCHGAAYWTLLTSRAIPLLLTLSMYAHAWC